MKEKEQYTLDELYDNLTITISELSNLAHISEVTIRRLRYGYPARRSTANRLLLAFSKAYDRDFSLQNVTGINLEDRRGPLSKSIAEKAKEATPRTVSEKPQKRKYKPRDTGLPEGCILASKFAEQPGVPPPTFTDHMLIGLGPGTVPGEIGDPMLPVKEQVDYSERDKSGRKGERERYLTPAQQKAALDFWKRHGVAFTIPESEQVAPADEPWWNEPGAE